MAATVNWREESVVAEYTMYILSKIILCYPGYLSGRYPRGKVEDANRDLVKLQPSSTPAEICAGCTIILKSVKLSKNSW